MPRNIVAHDAPTRFSGASSAACLAVVVLLAIGFWAGVLWVGSKLLGLAFG